MVGSIIASDKVSTIADVERFSWIFVSRLATKVKSTNIEDHVKSICGNINVVYEELRTKFLGYRSFKFRVPLECKDDILNTKV